MRLQSSDPEAWSLFLLNVEWAKKFEKLSESDASKLLAAGAGWAGTMALASIHILLLEL